MKNCIFNNRGFTLIEIIISLIVAGIMGAILVTFTGTALQRSSKGAFDMVEFYRRNQILDNITADYRANIIHRTDTALNVLVTDIAAGNYDDPGFASVTAQYIAYTTSSPPVEQTTTGGGYLKVTVTPASGIDGVDMVVLYTK